MVPKRQSQVLVLGGSGIIGREFVNQCALAGYTVTSVSRGQTSERAKDSPGVRWVRGDVRSKDFLEELGDRRWDFVIDLLSFNPRQLTASLGALADTCSQFVFVSSATVFDGSKELTIREDSPFVDSSWSYPRLKLECESLLRLTSNRTGLPFTIVRPYITYSDQRISLGPWEGAEALGRMARDCAVPVSSGLQDTVTTLTHAADVATAIRGLLGNPSALRNDFNVVSDQAVSWDTVFNLASYLYAHPARMLSVPEETMLGVFPELRGKLTDRGQHRRFDISKLRQAVPDFVASYSLEQGYASALEAYMSRQLSEDIVLYGRQGRLVEGCGSESDLLAERRFRATLNRSQHVRYLLGRNPYLLRVRNLVNDRVRGVTPTNDYGLDRG